MLEVAQLKALKKESLQAAIDKEVAPLPYLCFMIATFPITALHSCMHPSPLPEPAAAHLIPLPEPAAAE